ncbi:FxDxF family PEP-CTERM protein [Duganella aceris]|uniref:PEP-CTERM sorting domain-containing protein n=1 Tax=Duganella aceris TaxID=2703883 RepID=A0ABX0FRK4_9BURK|nr:FxDxF family PEP-CTERM protein [Duganella aceris]NGZ87170.1 PEP-CTERM sorting domain-containing protein [Duganella aceris]
MKKYARMIVASAALLAATAAQAATVYDATADFQTVSNPGTVWSYGYSAGTGYSFTAFDAASTLANTNGWSASNYNTLGTPGAWINTSNSSLYGAAPGQLSLHAGPVANGDSAILRFTAVQSGDYSVVGQFFAGDYRAQSGSVILNGQTANPLAYFADTTDSSLFSLSSVHLNAGQTLDFVVGNNGNFYNGTTPLTVTVTAVPEPETYAMLLAGLCLVGAIARRKRAA